MKCNPRRDVRGDVAQWFVVRGFGFGNFLTSAKAAIHTVEYKNSMYTCFPMGVGVCEYVYIYVYFF